MNLEYSLGYVAIKEGVDDPDLIHPFLLEFAPSPIPNCIFVAIDPPGTPPLYIDLDRGPFLDGILHRSPVVIILG
jgi:hypothetical protein